MPDLTNALVAEIEWKKVPAAMFEHLVESLPRRVEEQRGDQLHINGNDFGMRCSTSSFGYVVYLSQRDMQFHYG